MYRYRYLCSHQKAICVQAGIEFMLCSPVWHCCSYCSDDDHDQKHTVRSWMLACSCLTTTGTQATHMQHSKPANIMLVCLSVRCADLHDGVVGVALLAGALLTKGPYPQMLHPHTSSLLHSVLYGKMVTPHSLRSTLNIGSVACDNCVSRA